MSEHEYTRSIADDGFYDLGNYRRPTSVETRVEAELPARAFTTKAVGTLFTFYFSDTLDSGETDLLDATVAQYISDVGSGLLPVPTPSVDITSVAVTNRPTVEIRKPDGLIHERVYGFCINFCDKTTWYHDSTKVTDEAVGTGDGVTTEFQLAHGTSSGSGDAANERIIDLSHGKVTDENDIATADTHREMGSGYSAVGSLSGYVPIVKVDGTELSERPFGDTSGGDYTINYITGTITFASPPPNGNDVTCTYWYVGSGDGALIRLVPPSGKKYQIDKVEIQSSSDSEMSSNIIMNVYAGAPPPSGFPVRRPTVVKSILDIVNYAQGSWEQIPAQGGSGARGISDAINIHRIEYISEVPLLSSMLMYMQVHLEDPVEFNGTWATVVIYGIEDPE